MVMTAAELEKLVDSLTLTEAGRVYLNVVRTSPPARKVQSSTLANCCSRYASARMGFVEALESHVEHRVALRCEFDRESVLEYWEQAAKVAVTLTDRRGRAQRSTYTADFLIIGPKGVTAIEAKHRQKCRELCEKHPVDWKETSDGFVYEAARRTFANLGVKHVVVTEDDISSVEASNYQLLLQSRIHPPKIPTGLRDRLIKILLSEKALPIGDLLKRLGTNDAAVPIFLIQAQILHADLRSQLLSNIDEAWVSLDAKLLAEVIQARRKAACAIDPSQRVSISEVPRTKDALAFVSRCHQLQGEIQVSASNRTLRRWRSAVRSTGSTAALIPRTALRGNRHSRLSEAHEALIEKSLREAYLTPDSLPPYRVYGHYRVLLIEASQASLPGERAVSFKGFLRRLQRLDPVEVASARGGKRAANAAAPPVPVEMREILATRPFERAHIDHCLLKLHLWVGESGGKVIRKRAWLTAMVDEATGAVLAMSLSFRNPSRRSCTAVLRDCACRWGRLPETVVVDNGCDFASTYFEACLARLGIHKQARPPGHPRYGSSIERLFGKVKDELLSTLVGNVANKREDRGKSTSHKGCYRGTHTLLDLYQMLENYLFGIANRHACGQRLQSAEALVRVGLGRFPMSGHCIVVDQAFLVLTAIEHSRHHSWDPQRGVRFRGRYYSHPSLDTLKGRRYFDVREEPWEQNCIYICTGNEWIACFHGPWHPGIHISPNTICESTTWADLNSNRKDISTDRMLAQQEEKALQRQIKDAEKASAPISKKEVPKALAAFSSDAKPLPRDAWREA